MIRRSFMVIAVVMCLAPGLFADGNGRLLTSYTSEGYVDYVAKGCGVHGVGEGWVSIDGIPEGAAVLRAHLYWGGHSDVKDTICALNGHIIIGPGAGKDGNYRCFRADVTSLVTGNGQYHACDFDSRIEGFSLVVVYEHQDLAFTRIVVSDGCDCNGDGGGREWMTPTYFWGFDRPHSFYARLTLIIGQTDPGSQYTDKYSFMGSVFAWNEADNSDGPRWDTDSFDTTGFFAGPFKHPYANVYEGSDHLGWCAAVFSVSYLSDESGKDQVPLISYPAVSIYPNPFNSSTNILVESAGQSGSKVEIYNIAGARVRLLQTSPTGDGRHIVRWDAKSDNGQRLPSGVYFCRFSSDGEIVTKKLLYVK
jgi:hypothetical protein